MRASLLPRRSAVCWFACAGVLFVLAWGGGSWSGRSIGTGGDKFAADAAGDWTVASAPSAGGPVLIAPRLEVRPLLTASAACGGCASPAIEAALDAAAAGAEGGSAVIVEPRMNLALEAALVHMAAVLPPAWLLVLVTRRDALQRLFASPRVRALAASGRLRVWELSSTSHAMARVCGSGEACGGTARVTSATMSHEGGGHATVGGGAAWAMGWPLANEAQVRPELYSALPTARYLVFQTDGLLCAETPLNGSAFSRWAPFAFVGAPWPEGWSTPPYHATGDPAAGVGGNGGFSLRDRDALARVVYSQPWDGENEDAWLSRHAVRAGAARLPPLADAAAFSLEGEYSTPHVLGFHKPWTTIGHALSSAQYADFARACPVAERTRALLEALDPPPVVAAVEAGPVLALTTLLLARLVAAAAAAPAVAASRRGAAVVEV